MWLGQQPFTEREARVRQHGRRHVFPLGLSRDPTGGRGRRADDLQAAGQRLRVDDRRAARSTATSRCRGMVAEVIAEGRAGNRRGDRRCRSRSRAGHCRRAFRSIIGRNWTRCRSGCAIIPACRCSSTTSRARPNGGACASAESGPIPTSARSSTPPCAKAAAIAARRRTACRSSRSKRRSAASGASTRRRATRTSAASRASARVS